VLVHHIGPYTFSEQDARKTVANLPILFELAAVGRDATVLDGLMPEFAGDLETDLPAAWAAWNQVGSALRAAGQLPSRTAGRVAQLNVSQGGLPKLPVPSASVSWRGMDGDRQATRVHHGRPWQALCLWSTEVIGELHSQGHPIAAGLAGENITLTGLPWNEVRPGVRLRIGTVLCEVSLYALPCFQNKAWFLDGEFEVMHHERGPVSRVYATVLEPGDVAIGDDAVLEP
jgi:MOSC domain-containing protein YiiM